MKSIYPILMLLITGQSLACLINYPFEYLAQESDIIIVGEIEKMDYDLPDAPPYEDSHYSLAYVKIDEVLKSDTGLKQGEYYTFKVASKKDPGTTATVYRDKGMKGTWFFTRENDPHGWVSTVLKPVSIAEKVKKELSHAPMRRFGKTFHLPQSKMEGYWPDRTSEEISIFQLITYHNLLAESGKSNLRFSLYEDLEPYLMIKKVDYDQTVIEVLRDITDQHDKLDFNFGDYQILWAAA